MPKVSIIIPTYNRAKLISRAIESVLAQTYKDYEIIIVDDGSTDNTQEVLAVYMDRIRYVRQSNKGISGARNRGIGEVQGEYVAFLDSDDTWVPEKLAVQVEVLDRNKKVGIVYSRMQIFDEEGKPCGFKPEEKTGKNYLELLEIRGDITTSTVVTRKECFDKVGVFDPNLPPMEDFDMWLRISRFYDIYEVESPILAHYFDHSHQATKNPFKVYEGLVKLETKMLSMADNAPQRIRTKIISRLTMHQYTLSRLYYKNGRFQESLQLAWSSIMNNPNVGLLFSADGENISRRLIKWSKPYGFLPICLFKRLFFSQKISK